MNSPLRILLDVSLAYVKFGFCYWFFQVYDVTPFMDDHPGGDEVLLSATGNIVMEIYLWSMLLWCLFSYLLHDDFFAKFSIMSGNFQEKMLQMISKMWVTVILPER